MDRFYLQWNAINWATVLLMVSIGYLAIGFVVSGVRQVSGNTPSNG